MKIGYFADGPWSHRAIENIVADNGLEVVFIVPRFDSRDPVLKRWADRLGIPFIPLRNINDPESIIFLRQFKADLFVSMSFDQIIRSGVLEVPPRGFINCHAGALPYYRGRNILNWALINDAREFGVTVHYIDEGIDTGDIILQKLEPITDADDYSTLLERAIEVCGDLLPKAVKLIATGQEQRIRQQAIDPVGFYCGRRREGDEWLNWNWSSRRIFNFVRGITTPGPRARTFFAGQEVEIEKVSLIEGAADYIGTPGEIVGRSERGVHVKTGSSTITVERIRPVQAFEQMRIGRRFSASVNDQLQSLEQRISYLEKKLL